MKKQVHTPDMVAHLWANQSQDSARNAGGTFYFEGDTIYSYGSHFPIATHHNTKRGPIVLLTTRTHSVTTARHVSKVVCACSHLRVFNVPFVSSWHDKENLASYKARYSRSLEKYASARSNKPYWFERMKSIVSEANSYAKYFGLKTRLSMPENTEQLELLCSKIVRENREKAKRIREAKRKEDEKREAERLEMLNAWLAGEDNGFRGHNYPVRLRISGDTIETTRGAEVPLAHALKVYPLIKKIRESGGAYQRNGHTIHLGQFALDSIDKYGNICAGCHYIEWEEIERIATLVGVN